MKPTKFIKQAEKTILTDIAITANKLMSVNNTNYLTCGLFLKLPIVVTCEQSSKVYATKTLQLADLNDVLAVYTLPGDITQVHFTFLYEDEKHLKHIYRVLEKHLLFFTYKYIKELQHIIRKHKTTAHSAAMAKIGSKHQLTYPLTILANDYAVNASMHQLFNQSKLAPTWNTLLPFINYDPSYDGQHEFEIMKSLVANDHSAFKPGKFAGHINQFTFRDISTYYVDESFSDTSISNLGDNLYRSIKEATSGGGSGAGSIFRTAFDAVKVDVNFIKKLKGSIQREVYNKTSNFHQSWASLNNTYRHLYNAPIPIFEEKKVNMIISVDNSGSMNQEDLQKLLYVIKESGKHIAKCTVLIHTTDVAQIFDLDHEYDISLHPEFMEAFGVQHASGGTSHSNVFKHIQKMKIQDPEQYIYCSFSDNWSDIESCIHNYPIMAKLSKYWIGVSSGKPVDTNTTGGTNITFP